MSDLSIKIYSAIFLMLVALWAGCGKAGSLTADADKLRPKENHATSRSSLGKDSEYKSLLMVNVSDVRPGESLNVTHLNTLLESNFYRGLVFTNSDGIEIFGDQSEPNMRGVKILSRSTARDGTSAVCLIKQDGITIDKLDLTAAASLDAVTLECAELWIKPAGQPSVRLSASSEDARAALLSDNGRYLAYFSREPRQHKSRFSPKIVLRDLMTGASFAWSFSDVPDLLVVSPVLVDDSGLSVSVVVTFGEAYFEHRQIDLLLKSSEKGK